MDRRQLLAAVGAAGVVGLAGCPARSDPPAETDGERASSQSTRSGGESGTTTARRWRRTDPADEPGPPFRVGAGGFERRTAGGYERLTVRGVNLGMARPGAFPGQAAITRAEYGRWLAAIGDIANVVRTYTVHPPAFYRALAAYNESVGDPLLLLQGTWVPHDDMVEAGDLAALSESVDREVRRTVDAVHGATTLPERSGHAGGTYDADVSDATLGYLFGVEWPPSVVAATNDARSAGRFEGEFLRTRETRPFERWLADRLDGLVAHETDAHGTRHPVAFVNWVTTDPLEHPYEPFPGEDRVSVDPDALRATDRFDAGTFAAYHAYPYYPDLLNETPRYVEYVDHRGERNSYAGYLDHLVGATDHPLLVAEFGVPSSRGIAHRDVHGRDQGRNTEREQGREVAAMYEDLLRAGAAGGVAFVWQDEWFKRTWNLDARSVPGRRPYWSNVETPEQGFGLLAFDPPGVPLLGGHASAWTDATVVASGGADAPPARTLADVRVTHDIEGLAVRLGLDAPVDWTDTNLLVTVGLTGRDARLPFGAGTTATADFAVGLAGPGESRLLVESRYDAFAREFGEAAGLPLGAYRDGSAGFVPVREPINLGYTVPPTDETVPFEAVETGRLRFGNGDPSAPDYDSLADVHVTGDTVELRLPWMLLNVADPSSKRRIATDWAAGLETTPFESVQVGAATLPPGGDGDAGAVGLVHAAPGTDGGRLLTETYSWEPWDDPDYDERLKRSYDLLWREWDDG